MERRLERWRGVPAALAVLVAAGGLLAGSAPPQHAPSKPPDRSGRTQGGEASFYSHREAGERTASGRPLALDTMTAASPTPPLGTRAKVTNTRTGQAAQVTITDRGPYAKGRVLDVTPKAAERLGIAKGEGTAPVKIKPISEPAPKPKTAPGAR